MSNFSNEALDKAIKAELDAIEKETASIGVTATPEGDIGVKGSVAKDLGKPGGWTFEALAEWSRKQKARAGAFFTWKG